MAKSTWWTAPTKASAKWTRKWRVMKIYQDLFVWMCKWWTLSLLIWLVPIFLEIQCKTRRKLLYFWNEIYLLLFPVSSHVKRCIILHNNPNIEKEDNIAWSNLSFRSNLLKKVLYLKMFVYKHMKRRYAHFFSNNRYFIIIFHQGVNN